MKSLPELLNFIITTLQRSPHCETVQVVNTQTFSAKQFTLKIRASLIDGRSLQIRLYYNQDHVDYAYQLLQGEQPIQRWDNKEHFPTLISYPHHFHTATGQVESSPLTGDPTHDLPMVLRLLFAE